MGENTVTSKTLAVATAWRWDQLAEQARVNQWDRRGLGLANLAERTKLSWYHTRGNEPLADFLTKTGMELMGMTAFGLGKLKRLCDLLEHGLKQENKLKPLGKLKPEAEAAPSKKTAPVVVMDLRGALKEWEVPMDFPVRLIRLPIRILNFCTDRKVVSVSELIALWEKLGADDLASRPGVGKATMQGLCRFITCLQYKDHSGASAFLPLDQSGRGLSLGRAVRAHLGDLKPQVRGVLERRLLRGMSLAQSGAPADLTRERARQMEVDFLAGLQDWMGWFAMENEEELEEMPSVADWMEWIGPLPTRKDKVLLEAALAYIEEFPVLKRHGARRPEPVSIL